RVHRRGGGTRAQLRGIRGRALPRRPRRSAGGAERGGGGARHVARADAPADHPPAGAPRGAPGHRQRLHRAPEGLLARVGDHGGGADEADDDHGGRRTRLARARAPLRGAVPGTQLPAVATRAPSRAAPRPDARTNDSLVVTVRGLATVLGVTPAAADARARALLERVGLASYADAAPHTLSGGQQQRVAIARALAMEPEVLLLDEPTSALDPRLVGEVLAVIADLAAGGQTMVIVTHEIGFARRVADRVVVLAGGRIVERGTSEEVIERPQAAETRVLLGAVR